jgi:hypothetical protein
MNYLGQRVLTLITGSFQMAASRKMKRDAACRKNEQQVILTVADNEKFDQAEKRAYLTYGARDHQSLLYQVDILPLNRAFEELVLYCKLHYDEERP